MEVVRAAGTVGVGMVVASQEAWLVDGAVMMAAMLAESMEGAREKLMAAVMVEVQRVEAALVAWLVVTEAVWLVATMAEAMEGAWEVMRAVTKGGEGAMGWAATSVATEVVSVARSAAELATVRAMVLPVVGVVVAAPSVAALAAAVEARASAAGGTEMAATAARPEASLVSSDQQGSGLGSVSACEYARPRTGQ